MKLLVAESREFAPEALDRLRRHFDVVAADLERPALLSSLADVDVLWVRLRHAIDAEVMSAGPRLRVIVTNTTGTDHIDLAEAARRDIRVLSLRGETEFLKRIRATAELTVGLLLALVRHIPLAAAETRRGATDRYPFKGHQLFEKTAGIVGYGRLGRIVGEYLSALGMKVLAADRPGTRREPERNVALVPLAELLPQADVVSLHADLRVDNTGMFGRDQFASMKPGAWFINTARGELVDEAALVESLERGHLAGAALDVMAEPFATALTDRPLWRYLSQHDNLIVTPHIGGYTFESLSATEVFLAEKLIGLTSLGSASSPTI
jgi:D-3-phosphoglycerate dehydrogenase